MRSKCYLERRKMSARAPRSNVLMEKTRMDSSVGQRKWNSEGDVHSGVACITSQLLDVSMEVQRDDLMAVLVKVSAMDG